MRGVRSAVSVEELLLDSFSVVARGGQLWVR